MAYASEDDTGTGESGLTLKPSQSLPLSFGLGVQSGSTLKSRTVTLYIVLIFPAL
jgi:hypothetical protein